MVDLTLNLKEETYAPYRKPNDTPLYIHKDSNHPPHVAKQLPNSINKRLNQISCNKEVFEKAKPDYERALEKSKLDSKLTFEEKKDQKKALKEQIKKCDQICATILCLTENKHR